MEKKKTKKRVSHRGDSPVINRKLRLLYVMDYLRTYSDENHPVKLKDIADAMTAKDIYTTRKALYDDFAALEEYGFEVIRVDNTYTYFYGNPLFEFAELKLLMDIIYASSFVSEKKSQKLIDKLKTFCSNHQRGQLSRQMLTVGVKSKNESVLYNVDTISEAMVHNNQISFQYADYATPDGKKHYRHDGARYIRSPFHLVYSDNQYYLLCYNAEKRRREHLRVDRMEDVKILETQPREGAEVFKGINIHDYTKYTFSMFSESEKTTDVTMRFTNKLRGAVYDRFGDVMFMNDGPHHFTITVPISVSPQFFGWVLGLGEQAVIMRPDSVRTQMLDYLQGITTMYNSAEE